MEIRERFNQIRKSLGTIGRFTRALQQFEFLICEPQFEYSYRPIRGMLKTIQHKLLNPKNPRIVSLSNLEIALRIFEDVSRERFTFDSEVTHWRDEIEARLEVELLNPSIWRVPSSDDYAPCTPFWKCHKLLCKSPVLTTSSERCRIFWDYNPETDRPGYFRRIGFFYSRYNHRDSYLETPTISYLHSDCDESEPRVTIWINGRRYRYDIHFQQGLYRIDSFVISGENKISFEWNQEVQEEVQLHLIISFLSKYSSSTVNCTQ